MRLQEPLPAAGLFGLDCLLPEFERKSAAMPNYNNAARKYDIYPDDEEYRQVTSPRRTMPNVPLPTMRTLGAEGQLTRPQSGPPAPLPGAAPRRPAPNVPAPSMYGGYAEDTGRRMPVRTPVAPARRPVAASNPLPRVNLTLSSNNLKMGLIALGVIGVLVVSYLVVSFAVHTWQVWQDDMTYGRPRITRLEANVGHNEVGGAKTMFIAQNLNGQISITEFPGGDPTKTRVIVGPRLFGKDKDLIPIKLSVKDVNMDGLPDLLVNAEDQQLVYINDNGNFRQANEQELSKLKAQGEDK
jgi:hypothetical protein